MEQSEQLSSAGFQSPLISELTPSKEEERMELLDQISQRIQRRKHSQTTANLNAPSLSSQPASKQGDRLKSAQFGSIVAELSKNYQILNVIGMGELDPQQWASLIQNQADPEISHKIKEAIRSYDRSMKNYRPSTDRVQRSARCNIRSAAPTDFNSYGDDQTLQQAGGADLRRSNRIRVQKYRVPSALKSNSRFTDKVFQDVMVRNTDDSSFVRNRGTSSDCQTIKHMKRVFISETLISHSDHLQQAKQILKKVKSAFNPRSNPTRDPSKNALKKESQIFQKQKNLPSHFGQILEKEYQLEVKNPSSDVPLENNRWEEQHDLNRLSCFQQAMDQVDRSCQMDPTIKQKIVARAMQNRWQEYDGPEYVEPEQRAPQKSNYALYREQLVERRRRRRYRSLLRQQCCAYKPPIQKMQVTYLPDYMQGQ